MKDLAYQGRRNEYLFRTYGLKAGEWEAIYASQGNVCAICGHKRRRMDTDHCHTTGKVRGILCHRCNVLLGHAKDDAARLSAAAAYLRKFVESNVLREQPNTNSV